MHIEIKRRSRLVPLRNRWLNGRFTTEEEVDFAVNQCKEAVSKLRELSPLWDMYKDGVDISKVEWVHH
jgi:cysteine desulfurase